MRGVARTTVCLGFLSFGYLIGSLQVGPPAFLLAEPKSDSSLPAAVRDRLREVNRNLSETMQALQEEKRYMPAIQGVNSFATSVGGVDALGDLESGSGVDPETFAGLYAGQAVAEVAEHLSRDAEGHLTYKNKVVRMYNPTRMKQMFLARAEFAPAAAAPTKRAAPAKKEAEAEPEK